MKNRVLAVVFTLAAISLLAIGIIFLSSPSQGGNGEPVKLGARSSSAPKAWVKETPSNKLRKAQFRLAKTAGDDKDAELAIFEHFGGSIKENVERWKSKFKPPTGKSIDEVSKVDEFKVNGVDVTYLDVSGTYKHQVPPDPKITLYPDHRMLAFIFDSDDGPYFVTLVGPQKTVAQHKAGFDSWLKGFK